MRKMLLLCMMTAVAVCASCSRSIEDDNRAVDAAVIQKLDEQWSATAGRNDLAGTVAFYADDAVLLPPNASIATNAKAIRDSWAGLLGPNTAVSWKVTKADVANPVN